MASSKPRVMLCNCEKTMRLDAGRIAGLDKDHTVHTQLCRAQMASFEKALATGEPLLIACTQEAPLFQEVAEERGADQELSFVNIRERAGWCATSTDPHPKISALLAEALAPSAPAALHSIESDGVCLVYGAGQQALDAARALEGRLSVSLLLSDVSDLILPATLEIPVHAGRIRTLKGSLGDFEVTVDGYAQMLPSSRGAPSFALARDGARANCSLILDLSGETPLVSAPSKRDGYMRVDPGNPAAVARAMFDMADMVGTFEKPLYVTYDASICAHGRSGKTGCTNCLDACPAGAISSTGREIAIDPGICGGCGSCAAHCPTGAVSYRYPERGSQIRKLQALLGTYREAGGKDAVLLVHESQHGGDIITALARMDDGLPGNVLPHGAHSVTSFGHDAMLAAVLAGARRIVFLCPPSKAHELDALRMEIELSESLLAGMGHQADGAFAIAVEDDPDAVTGYFGLQPKALAVRAASFDPVGTKRDVARSAIARLLDGAPAPQEMIALPAHAPYGRIQIASDGCTLCLACVSACPTAALSDNPDKPQVSITEAACVQCGLCANTCPEQVITLDARYNAAPSAMRPEVLHEEEPATCVSCGKAFGTRSSIARIREKLSGKHWMFQRADQIALIEMCDDCRISAQWEMDDTPLRGGARPRIVTTDDYLAMEKGSLTADDFLKDN
ncbi:4Fe-4S dicluster domain-containing protein [Stappia indica]|uniref:4Fe-4S dicluster domain-containing protein n=1 Tax=Stappia indica TaxID=538381 RepID=UPI001D17D9E4|nr:4Fe-4S dicluster domain-containing protein [Stappia indica]MCC4245853.1 4Fe-4S dicluster domain-containing protein [Stappia indica]